MADFSGHLRFKWYGKSDHPNSKVMTITNDSVRARTKINVVKYSPVSTGRLKRLLAVHHQPINLIVSQGAQTKPVLGTGFALICFQRLSSPYIATLRCLERDNRNTRGTSLKILSY